MESSIVDENERKPNFPYNPNISINRPTYSQSHLLQEFSGDNLLQPSSTWKKSCRNCFSAKSCCNGLLYLFPFIRNLRGYRVFSDLPNDLLSGLTIGVMHVPQGIAYSLLASLHPIYGLYASFFPALIYFFLGTSKHVSMGTSALTTIMLGTATDKAYAIFHNRTTPIVLGSFHVGVDPFRLILALGITCTAGIIQLIMGCLRLGVVNIFLSDAFVSGFMTAGAFHIAATQIPPVLGITVRRYTGPLMFFRTLVSVFGNVPKANPVTIIMSIISMVIMLLIKICINSRFQQKMKIPVPIELIMIVIATIISHFGKFPANFKVTVVGTIPRGFPAPIVPGFSYMKPVIGDIISLAVINYVLSLSLARLFAKRHKYVIHPTQELIAYGTTNVFGSFFGAYISSAALARSSVQEGVGGKTQVAGLISSAFVLVVIFGLGPYMFSLPVCILSSIIIVNLKGLFSQFGQLPSIWRICKFDFFIWIVTFLATLILNLDLGLLVGVAFSILTVIWRSRWTSCIELGQIGGTDLYKDVKRYTYAKSIDGIKIFRFGTSLCYTNSDYFYRRLYNCLDHYLVEPDLSRSGEYKLRKRKASISEQNGDIVDHESSVDEKTECKVTFSDEISVLSSSSIQSNVTDYVHTVIIDCSMMDFVDKMGLDTLKQIVGEMNDLNKWVYFTSLNVKLYNLLHTFGLTSESNVMVMSTVHDAVTVATAKHHDQMSIEDTHSDDHLTPDDTAP